ncbi:CPBP family intramembrane glutamic endopeptidase [Nonomuraea dietziae]|uniref:Membrane protease YdiL (CAAX protease family) n=1 Tax=Nonomuraea dietziae TaxID=65515 RepID=A0A7W5V6N7_9ACTN|nr:CPBP family intramembrane glutamic endopeptidase [Nonomuraea dietziae]MBB3728966.1 membrane protease YdiL (CAAX protease family) [Nonomuraea dietziae]
MSRSAIMTGVGLAAFVVAYATLILTGNTEIRMSADPGAAGVTLWATLLPPLAAIILARLVPPRVPPPQPLAELPRPRLVTESRMLVAAALVFPLAVLLVGRGLLYPVVKVAILLVVPLVGFRLLRKGGPAARSMPAPVTWLAPLPAVLTWFLLAEVSPLSPPLTQQLPDPVTLAVGSLITLLTASVLEEIFYRGWLQTRLEALYGTWPGILVTSLLFAAMHVSHIRPDAIGIGLASVVAAQGLFGLMQGCLWARYRNIWVIILIHVVVNLVYVDMLIWPSA